MIVVPSIVPPIVHPSGLYVPGAVGVRNYSVPTSMISSAGQTYQLVALVNGPDPTAVVSWTVNGEAWGTPKAAVNRFATSDAVVPTVAMEGVPVDVVASIVGASDTVATNVFSTDFDVATSGHQPIVHAVKEASATAVLDDVTIHDILSTQSGLFFLAGDNAAIVDGESTQVLNVTVGGFSAKRLFEVTHSPGGVAGDGVMLWAGWVRSLGNILSGAAIHVDFKTAIVARCMGGLAVTMDTLSHFDADGGVVTNLASGLDPAALNVPMGELTRHVLIRIIARGRSGAAITAATVDTETWNLSTSLASGGTPAHEAVALRFEYVVDAFATGTSRTSQPASGSTGPKASGMMALRMVA